MRMLLRRGRGRGEVVGGVVRLVGGVVWGWREAEGVGAGWEEWGFRRLMGARGKVLPS
jgi:hypothetical protein